MNKENVLKYMEKGFNCSQTVLSYFANQLGIDEIIAKKIAAPFESGMFQGDLCGAASGAYMVLGLRYSLDDPQKSRSILEKKVTEFNRKFKKQQEGHMYCKDILGMDISKPESLKKAFEEGLIQEKCPSAIFLAISVLEEMIK